jgi:hypothetical protein
MEVIVQNPIWAKYPSITVCIHCEQEILIRIWLPKYSPNVKVDHYALKFIKKRYLDAFTLP